MTKEKTMKTTREIKFRFYMVDKKKMVFPKVGYGNFSDLKETADWKVMQYTGLKDRNGKEIYEGDYVEIGSQDIQTSLSFMLKTERIGARLNHKSRQLKTITKTHGMICQKKH